MNSVKSLMRTPLPSKMNLFYKFGSLVGLFLVMQIVSGVLLVCGFSSSLGFQSCDSMHRESVLGDLFRLTHSKGASFFFMFMYLHVARGLFLQSFYHNSLLWLSGCVILLLSQLVAFLGYVLPTGNMSYWGATVMTKLMSVFPGGSLMVAWVWGGSTVGMETIGRFFMLHYLIPLIMFVMVVIHVFFLHESGSTNPLGGFSVSKMSSFFPYFMVSDLVGLVIGGVVFFLLLGMVPYVFSDPKKFLMSNPLVTPTHIVPEWYFLPHYAVLRSVDKKIGGVMLMVLFACCLFPLPFGGLVNNCFHNIMVFLMLLCFGMLMFLGGQTPTAPFTHLMSFFTFGFFVLIMVKVSAKLVLDYLKMKF